MVGTREAKILAKTFRDRLTVYRKHLGKDPDTLETVEKEDAVYEDIACALSQKSNNAPERQEFHSETQREFTIFTIPGIELEDNDKVAITTETGQIFEGITGKTFAYVSHGETPFSVEKIT